MTQSWSTQQALRGNRTLFPGDAKLPSAHQKQSQGGLQLRMSSHPRLAPQKSMLADDLKLSSDEDDTQEATEETAPWNGLSLSAQRVHTHGRRVRHSSSDSSGSDCSVQSSSSSLRSRSPSPSPEVHPDPPLPANAQPACSGNKERAPSPARSWDSNQEYSPSQTPIPSPQLHYSHISSPIPSPGYSYCPSPSPFPSTCPSPGSSSLDSAVPSPGLSVCPSPHGSPRTSRTPSPSPRDPPKSPCPSPAAPSRVRHFPEVHQTQPSPTITPHRSCPTRRPKPVEPSQPANSSYQYQAPVPKVPAGPTSNKRLFKSGQQGPTDGPKEAHPRGSSSGKTSEGKQKLYTLVPFGRGDKAPAFSQRGLRNLVVQIDLCLLKRVPESPAGSPGKKTPSSSGYSSTKNSQREMKHALVSETGAKDGRRKRKLEHVGETLRESKRTANEASSRSRAERSFVTETSHNSLLEEYLDSKRLLSPVSPLSDSPDTNELPSKSKASEHNPLHTHVKCVMVFISPFDPYTQPKMEVECIKAPRHHQAASESWGPAGHRGTMPNHDM
ncbi:unnamed protein product [Tetraodon nigroviridis]|uniref:(spotted green pufferfish) hypothetical protein n=1 Tax=Tetraodon nigroviridis TaxID=99883 RepID=Q4S0P3_TETNG|nr:unnamed protein product [Tetraodon nigroviridis]